MSRKNMKSKEEAAKLAKSMISHGREYGLPTKKLKNKKCKS